MDYNVAILGLGYAIIVAVAHSEFEEMDWKNVKKNDKVIFDVKAILPLDIVTSRL